MARFKPNWMMVDRFVYRRDDEEAFPDESSAPLRASSCTSLGQRFEVALLPAIPPAISRFYVRWPGGTKPEEGNGTELVEAHRDLLLVRLTSVEKLEVSPYVRYIQDHFVCIATSEPKTHLQLKWLPVCTVPVRIPPSVQKTIPPRKEEGEEKETVLPRVFFPKTVGLMRHLVIESDIEEFVVAQLTKVGEMPGSHKMEAEICVLRSRVNSDDGDGWWGVKKIPIQHKDDEYRDLWYWSTDDVVTFDMCICWVDYYRGGMLIYDVLNEQPRISYKRLNIKNRPTDSSVCHTLPEMTRRLCVTTLIGEGKKGFFPTARLRFVEVTRSNKFLFDPFELGSGFTISSSTLWSVNGAWVEDFGITSQDLWTLNSSSGLPHEMLMFPLVNMDNTNIVHFLVSHYVEEDEIKKVSVATLDFAKKKVMSVVPYIAGGEDADMIKEKSHLLKGFVASTFPMFLKSESDRREMMATTRRELREGMKRRKAGGSSAK